MPPFDREFFGGRAVLELEADTLLGMVRALDGIAPGFANIAESRAAFAIDGVFTPNWSTAVVGAAEVILLPRVSGG